MQVIVLAAGRGTRMRPLTENVPKPMLPVGSAPMVERVAEAAVDAGAERLVFVVGYEQASVREHFGSRYEGVPVTHVEQDELLGTADAVRAAADHVEGQFAVLNGDNMYDAESLRRLFDSGPGIGAYRVETPSNYGVLRTRGDAVEGLVEKPSDPPSDLVNAGAYVFPADATALLDVPKSERGEFELTDVVNRVIDDRPVSFVEFDRWSDVGRPWELLEATASELERQPRRLDGSVHREATVSGNVVVEPGASVKRGVTIEGPVRIGAGSTVGPNAYLRGATYLGADVRVGSGVEIKNSVLMAGTAVPHLSYVGDSVLGRDVNLGAGTNVANLRHDREPVNHTVKGDRVSTGRRKFGAVIGDGARTGINTSLDPGVTLSAGATTTPGERVSRDK
ncbi:MULTISPECIES: bifunctional sugar-1-phosphate nucleotidylyltransferase/acetyltransferase [unclassified Halorubrum]|uniref:bifunctional sugar-1-phosphate nucleotidylyltransferase/acetyltransferase n=1 Tax=unclassified Halorubrum TaxID=2642239 RepID=UPI000B97F9B9|nr:MULTISPECIES: bifunctional sugar-1-phosphate nucleotidylyltransferase/acetyltransferase [unclassified Halorubrum]OYR45561.1 glucose-1-phosphate thymidylyltransferase [Halorubrum sp. Hd13]OYR47934.1 glucose-1-phosphate thymidylyltransferase [Halorubrum sp. Ea8]